MSRKLRPLTKGQLDVIDSLAALYVVEGIARNVPEMEDFANFYVEKQRPKARQYMGELNKAIQRTREDLRSQMKEDLDK